MSKSRWVCEIECTECGWRRWDEFTGPTAKQFAELERLVLAGKYLDGQRSDPHLARLLEE